MRNLNRVAYSPRSMRRLRACWAVHGPVGRAVTPRMWTRRVWISIAKNTYRRWRNTVSTCRRSHARIPDAWAARNCRQVGDARRGAGVSPAAARIRRMVRSRAGARGRGAHPGCGGVPIAGSAWPAAGPAHGSPPGPAGARCYWDRSTCSSPCAGATRAAWRVSRSGAAAGAWAAAARARLPPHGRPSPVSGGRPGGAGLRPRAAVPRSPRPWRRRCGRAAPPSRTTGS